MTLNISARIEALWDWPDGWNGYNARAPQAGAIEHALWWIAEVARLYPELQEPRAVTSDGEGDVVFEWECDDRSLTIYVEEQEVGYVEVYGRVVDSPITDGDLTNPKEALPLFAWLYDRPLIEEVLL